MPAIITHDLFGKDVYGETFDTIGGSRDAAEAFLLGNQGPILCSSSRPIRATAAWESWPQRCIGRARQNSSWP